MPEIKQVVMVTVCGRPNVGKSSLTNALVGEKIAIVSNKAQTTRNRIYGVACREDTQFILLDTPGLHRPKSALGDYMVKVVTASLSDVDCALLLVEPIPHVVGRRRPSLTASGRKSSPVSWPSTRLTPWSPRSCSLSSPLTAGPGTASTPSYPFPPARATAWGN